MQSQKSIRLSPTTTAVISRLCLNDDVNSVFGRNVNLALADCPTLFKHLGIMELREQPNWEQEKERMVDFRAESGEYTMTSVILNSKSIEVIKQFTWDDGDINYSGTINMMFEDINACIKYKQKPLFTLEEWSVLRAAYAKLPIRKLRISDELVIAKNCLISFITKGEERTDKQKKVLTGKLSRFTRRDLTLLLCHLRGLPVKHSNNSTRI